jgi:hypothetical protein
MATSFSNPFENVVNKHVVVAVEPRLLSMYEEKYKPFFD